MATTGLAALVGALAGCGAPEVDNGFGLGDDAPTATYSYDSLAGGDACRSVWRSGRELPAAYQACLAGKGDGQIERSVVYCQDRIAYEDGRGIFAAQLGHSIRRITDEQLADLQDCDRPW